MARQSKVFVNKTEAIKRNIREGNALVVDGEPYIHSDVEWFRIGYAAIAPRLHKQLQEDFKKASADFDSIAITLKNEEDRLLTELEVENVDQLNQIFLLCENSSIGSNVFFTEVLKALQIFKQSALEATVTSGGNKNTKSAALTAACAKLQSVLNKHANGLLSGNAFAQTQKLLGMITNGVQQLSIQVGNAYEEVFVAWWSELMTFLKTNEGQKVLNEVGLTIGGNILNAIISQIGNVDQKEKTTDVEATLGDTVVGFTLKSGRGYNWQKGEYSDMFTGVKGYVVKKSKYTPEAPSPTKYKLSTLHDNGVLKPDTYSSLLYVLLNYKLLAPGKSLIENTLKIVQYGLAWYHLMDELFGSSFKAALESGNLKGFPVFLVTLNGIYSLATFCHKVAQSYTKSFDNAGSYITAYNLSRYASPLKMSSRQSAELATIKNDLIKTSSTGQAMDLSELQYGMLKTQLVSDLIKHTSNDLGYLITYRININNLMNFMPEGA